MSQRLQVRLISLLEEAANSFEQLETLTNRTLRELPVEQVLSIELRAVERDVVEQEGEVGSEMDHVMVIQYRTDLQTGQPT